VTLALLVFGSRPASADPVVLFSNFGPGGTFGPQALPILGPGLISDGEGPEFTPGQQAASSFSLAQAARLTSVDLALGVGAPFDSPTVPVDVILQLVRDEAGLPGTTVLGTVTVRAVTSWAEGGSVVGTSFTTQPLLSAGSYWLIAGMTAEGRSAAWAGNPSDSGTGAIRRLDTEWSLTGRGAFRLFGDRVGGEQPAPVPEPATVTLAAAGLAGMFARARRRRRCRRAT
jgi:hypothetical protein